MDDPAVVKVLAATVGALLTSLVATPLDALKVRMQAQDMMLLRCKANDPLYIFTNNLFDHVEVCPVCTRKPGACAFEIKGTFSGLYQVAKHEGPRGLWRGLTPTLFMSVPATILYFVGYEELRGRLQSSQVPAAPLLAGSMARILAVSVISPLELLKTSMQHGQQQQSSAATIRIAVRQQGFRVLWRGLIPTLWRDVPFSAIYWTGYERIRAMLHRKNSSLSNSFASSFTAGALSGMFAAALTTPFDVAKTRRQVGIVVAPQPPNNNMFSQILGIWRREGLAALFTGVWPRVLRVGPACAIMISSYEVVKASIK